MASLQQLHRAWQQVAENKIRSAQEEGQFKELVGWGHPLEEVLDISDPHGWIRRSIRDATRQPHPTPTS